MLNLEMGEVNKNFARLGKSEKAEKRFATEEVIQKIHHPNREDGKKKVGNDS